MENYFVTKSLTKLGYYLCVGLVIIFAISGVIAKGISGGLAGAFIGALLSVPTMMFCEMCFALIKIEENTRKMKTENKESFKHVA